MLPIPTASTRALLIGAALAALVGITTGSWQVVVLSGSGLLLTATAFAMTMPLGRRVRRERLEFAWWLGHGDPSAGGGAVVPGKPFDVRCFLRHGGERTLELRDVRPIAPGGASYLDPEPDVLRLEPGARTEFDLELVAPAVGRVVLHGLAVTLPGPLGLFEVPLYFPNPLVIKVLPRAAVRLRGMARTVTGQPVERSGASLLSPAQGGTELRELREHRPGDSFKAIAWKASSRRGRLMVREVDQEVQETSSLVVDVSGTMRGGAPGRRKLDFVIEAAAAESQRALDQGDRVGLAAVDGRVLTQLAPDDGRPHLLRVYEALLDATETVDGDLTEIDDDEVAAVVGRYVRQQDGLDFSTKGGEAWNVAALARHVERALEDERSLDDLPLASSPTGARLRRFCRVRGIPLPYRSDPRDGVKAPGLADAIQAAIVRSRAPMSILVLTDFDALGDPEPLLRSVKLARLRGHAIAFVWPDAVTFAPEPRTPLERDVRKVYARGEERRFAEARAMLLPLGAPVIRARADDEPGLVLARARSAWRGRRAA